MPERTCIDCGHVAPPRAYANRCEPCHKVHERNSSLRYQRNKYTPKAQTTITAQCADCKGEWQHPSGSRHSVRCPRCRVEHKALVRMLAPPRRAPLAAMECATCGASFTPRTKVNRYCSIPCQERARVLSGKQKAEVRRWALRTKWKMTPEDFDKLLVGQAGRCAACGTNHPGGRFDQWNIDHDHRCCPGGGSCGRCIRGLLCNRCNRAAGQMNDNAAALRGLADYLDHHNSHQGPLVG